jgi:rRNA-processing protein FCF1
VKNLLVLVDTNAWLILAEGRGFIDEIGEALETKPDFYCTRSVIRELREKALYKGTTGIKAKRALELAEKYCKVIEIDGGSADKDILNISLEYKKEGYVIIVVTSDRKLRKKLREHNITTMYYREKQDRFELEDKTVL